MKRAAWLLSVTAGCFILMLNLESCYTRQALVSCPDLYRAVHHSIAMHQMHHPAVAKQGAQPKPQSDAHASERAATTSSPPSVTPLGTASLTNDIIGLKSAKDLFKMLTENQRLQVKDQITSTFSKTPLLKSMALKRFDKLDKKYPAPREVYVDSNGNPIGGNDPTGQALSIIAFVFSVTIILSLVGLILGIIALVRINKNEGKRWARILAILAIVFGAIGFALILAEVALLLALLFTV